MNGRNKASANHATSFPISCRHPADNAKGKHPAKAFYQKQGKVSKTMNHDNLETAEATYQVINSQPHAGTGKQPIKTDFS